MNLYIYKLWIYDKWVINNILGFIEMSQQILILGANGQVGSAFRNILGDSATYLARKDLDLADLDNIEQNLAKYNPKIIINTAAYTAVDKAEQEPELAYKINADAPGIIADYAHKANIPLIHYSTDYVFNGSKTKPWAEGDATDPLSIYGKSKLLGEEKIIASGADYFIFRTSWVYNETGANFLNTMLRLGREREVLKVVHDQIGAPTYAHDLAASVVSIIDNINDLEGGIYHLTNEAEISWYDFAVKIFDIAKKYDPSLIINDLIPILTSEYPTPATRPLNSRLSLDKVRRNLAARIIPYEQSLEKCIKKKFS